MQQHNSVTIKAGTNVKDAAGAICKVLARVPSALITALRLEATHDSLNRAIKSIAVGGWGGSAGCGKGGKRL